MEENFVVNEELLDLISQCHDTVQRYVNYLEKKISQQEKRIVSYLEDKKKTHRDVGAQVPEEAAEPEPSDAEQNDKTEEVVTNIVEDIKQLSDEANQLGERFLYEQTTGLYYDTTCGYYYDATRCLYYDGATGTYFSYNYETGNYEVVQQQTPEQPERRRRRARRRMQPNETSLEEDKDEKKTEENEPKEEGEISGGSESESSYLSTPIASPFSPGREETAWEEGSIDFYKLAIDQPPCVRIIVQSCKSNPEMAGMFSIIPYTGGEIGRSNPCLVSIDDELLEDVHVKISYDEAEKIYKVANAGISALTINGRTLLASDPAADLVHGSTIEVGSSKLLIHIHRGAETCGHCEPGLIKVEKEEPKKNTVVDVKKGKDGQRRKEIRRLKEKYGIQKPIEKVEIPEGYEDKAEARRKKHGVDCVNAKVETASIHEQISQTNKGFKMLAKMGWSSGEGIGKKQGIAEPVTVEVRHSKVGLGAADYSPAPQTFKQKQKRENLLKTKERFEKLPEKIDEHSGNGDGTV